ncbi:hypothetical protein HHK36_020187 [Tetracentron sinense]|uniref:Disease resistance R13L4/SHOC-2-like LRR domain-containing protein n=1 Tax=Tetracentron sinense TaxID=13715 RepID=A0A834YUL8_TETSI|nr:hypothetical protein HHK36_020187 [Tetracentron sinense]
MRNLRWLDVMLQGEEVLDLQTLSSPPLLLQRLHLTGHLGKFPNWISSLHNLKRISLGYCGIRDDPLEVLQDLANLVDLILNQAYDGEELCFKAGGFRTLKLLYLCKLERLKLVTVEEGAMPNLEELNIVECEMLEKVPLGIECLTNLNFFDFAGTGFHGFAGISIPSDACRSSRNVSLGKEQENVIEQFDQDVDSRIQSTYTTSQSELIQVQLQD